MHVLFEYGSDEPLNLWQVRQTISTALSILYGQKHTMEFEVVMCSPKTFVVKTESYEEVVCACMTVRINPTNQRPLKLNLVEMKDGPLFFA